MQPGFHDNTLVVRRWGELWSTGDLEGADKVFSNDVYDHRGPPSRDLSGIEAEKQFIAVIRSAFPDLRIEIEDMVAEGDRVAARVIHRGTHWGPFLGIPATGRPVTYEAMVIFRIVGGRIHERWGTVDLYGIALQLGVSALPSRL